jgi:S1-C subfamily serine protease
MKKRIVSIFIIVLILLFGSCELNIERTETDYERILHLKEKYLSALNEISIDFMSSNIMVQVASYSSQSIGQGSGVVFKKEITGNGFKYYVMTNYHVTSALSGLRQFSSTDYMDKEINSNLIFEDKNYDLAVISFISASEYNVCKFADANPEVGDGIFAIGQPLGQRNAITFGYVEDYLTKEYDWCNINFDCIFHSAYMDSGNSGGVLLNGDIELCGINFATGQTNTVNNSISISIPVLKVKECLTTHSITI